MRVNRAFAQLVTGVHAVTALRQQVLAVRNLVLFLRVAVRDDIDLADALARLADVDGSVNLGDCRRLFHPLGLEQLGDLGQTAGDVARAAHLAHQPGQRVAGQDFGLVVDDQVGAGRQRVRLEHLALGPDDGDARVEPMASVLGDDPLHALGPLVDVLAQRHPDLDVVVRDLASGPGDNRYRVRLPFEQGVAFFDFLAVVHADERAGRYAERHHPVRRGEHHPSLVRCDRLAVGPLDRHQPFVLHLARELRGRLGLFGHARGDAADVKGLEGQLGARLADGLGGNNADRLADLDDRAGRHVPAVALHAQAGPRLAGEYRPHPYRFDTIVFDFPGRLVADRLAGVDDDLTRHRVDDVVERETAGDSFGQRLDDIRALAQRRDLLSENRAAVLNRNHHVLRHVDQPAGQVPGLGGLQRGVGQPLACAVGRDEVLPDRQPFTEGTLDRGLDDLFAYRTALRLGHQPTHAADLGGLGTRAARARVDEHEHRVEAVLVLAQPLHQRLFDLGGRERPGVHDEVVLLGVGHQAAVIGLVHLLQVALAPVEDGVLLLGDHDVVDADGEPGARRLFEPEVLDRVEQLCGHFESQGPAAGVDERHQLFLGIVLVHEPKLLGQHLVEQDPAHDRVIHLAVVPELDRVVDVELPQVVSGVDGVEVVEGSDRLGSVLPLPGNVIDPDDDVLRRRHQRPAVRRREDVVRREQEHRRLKYGFRRQGHVDRHRVAVKVGVKRRADERMYADCPVLGQNRKERLDRNPVQGRRAVQHHRVVLGDFLKYLPHLRRLAPVHALRPAFAFGQAAFLESAQDHRLKQLERHLLGQAALVELERRVDDNDRTARVVDALAEQVAAEPALLAPQRLAERLERPVAASAHGSGPRLV